MSLTLAKLINNFYIIKNNDLNVENYTKILIIYSKVIKLNEKNVNIDEWNSFYVHNKTVLPESPPNKSTFVKILQESLRINHIDYIYTYYSLLDNLTDVKKLTNGVIKKFEFIVVILSKQSSNSIIDVKTWNSIRNKCLIGKTKTKMPREPVILQDIINSINNILSLNS